MVKNVRFITMALIVAGCCLTTLRAQQPAQNLTAVSDYLYRIWQTDQGLPQNFITSLCQTHDGYIWIGTQQGLARFDGVQFTRFDRGSMGTPSHDIIGFAEDNQGVLWIATLQGGLLSYQKGKFTVQKTSAQLYNHEITAISADKAGNVWLGLLDKGLAQINNGTLKLYTAAEGLSNTHISSLTATQSGRLWVGTNAGLFFWERGVLRPDSLSSLLPDQHIRTILESKSGTLWIGTDKGLAHRTTSGQKVFTNRDGLPDEQIQTLAEDQQGNVWIGTKSKGVVRLSGATFQSFDVHNGLPSNIIFSLFVDKENLVWIGTLDGGLVLLREPRVQTITGTNGLPGNIVVSIAEDQSKSMWIGTFDNGVGRLLQNKWSQINTTHGLAGNTICCLAPDSKGGMWVGTFGSGITYFVNGKTTTYTTRHGLPDNTVWAVFPDKSGNVWFGTANGLVKMAQGKFTTFTTQHGLAGNTIWCITEDQKGTLWIGTDKGLSRFVQGKFVTNTFNDGLADNDIRSFMEENDGTMWIGTSGGLTRFSQGKFIPITNKKGLFDGMVNAILADTKGWIWMSHSKGISRVLRSELQAVVNGNVDKLTMFTFGLADGMKTAECNGGTQPAAWKKSDGTFWFPTSKGIVVINPENLKENTQAPEIIIEKIRADNQWFTAQQTTQQLFTFSPSVEKFEFHYTATSFRVPERVRFRYKLEGYDKDWIDADIRRIAYYTNLPHNRTYKFRVKACNDSGVWNVVGTSTEFFLTPFFYETWWFLATCVLGAGGFTFATYRWRVFRLQQRALELQRLVDIQAQQITQQAEREYQRQLEIERIQERDRISQDMHDDIGATLTEISMLGEILHRDIHQTQPDINKIQEKTGTMVTMARDVVDMMAEIVWAMNSKNDTLDNLVMYLRNFAARYLERSNIEYTMKIPDFPVLEVRSEIRRTIVLLMKETLHNIVKHAAASNVTIMMELDGGKFTINVIDNGKGFSTDTVKKTGHGLTNFKQRTEKVGGSAAIHSEPGHGTTVQFIIPVQSMKFTALHEQQTE